MLDLGLDANEIARVFKVAGPPAVERRISRMGATETPLAERFRRTKVGYCPECRRAQDLHLVSCSNAVETTDVQYRRRKARVAA